MRALAPILVLSMAAIALPTWADFPEPPTITVVDAERLVAAVVNSKSSKNDEEITNTAAGPFVEAVATSGMGELGSSGRSSAHQKTTISAYSIGGQGGALGDLDGSLAPGQAEEMIVIGLSSLNVELTIPVDAPYSLSGHFSASGEFYGTCLSASSVSLWAFSSEEFLFSRSLTFDCHSDPEDSEFLFTGDLPAGATLILSVVANAFPQMAPPSLLLEGVGTATFDFLFDLGDRDGDGLLDAWEENGIDFAGAGIEIDLPALGADPDHKDLFVEMDLMSGVPFDPAVLTLVEEAFAAAPGDMIANPDGEPGIRLHIVHDDGDTIPFQPLSGTEQEVLDQLTAIKASFLGSAADRSHPSVDAIKRARGLIFRYALWADTVVVDEDSLGGWAEIVGNDLVVASGSIVDQFSLSEIPDLASLALAGNFMHELGHTLGLLHGGQDDENLKPHYLSVMNYRYVVPYDVETDEGTNLADTFELDYSRSAMGSVILDGAAQSELVLDEFSLRESEPIAGPSGRRMFFNSALFSDPMPVNHTVAWAEGPSVDWDNDGVIDPGTLDVPIDLTRMPGSALVDYQQNLRAYTDWDRLWYHLSGAPNFEDAGVRGTQRFSVGIPFSVIEAFLSIPAFDQTTLIFKDGFELGLEPWSATVPPQAR